MSVQPESTWVLEFSWEAHTLDYICPRWNAFDEVVFLTEEAAEEAVAEKNAARFSGVGEGPVWRSRKVVVERPETGYSDPWLEAEFAANRQYWADRARAARQAEEAQREFEAAYGKGKVVKVVKGRKVPVGTEGTVFWLGESQWGWRVGFKDFFGETHWTAVSNVEPVGNMVEVDEAGEVMYA